MSKSILDSIFTERQRKYWRPKVADRLKSIGTDLVFSFMMILPFNFAASILVPMSKTTIEFNLQTSTLTQIQFTSLQFLVWLVPILFFNKDFFYGRSPGKYEAGLQVIDIKTGNPATSTQCLIRNITFIIAPIEMIYLLFSPERRIGDYLAKTKVLATEAEEAITFFRTSLDYQFTESSWLAFFTSVILTFLLTYTF
jgi:uncharacterized RDD family membrane protein YckC